MILPTFFIVAQESLLSDPQVPVYDPNKPKAPCDCQDTSRSQQVYGGSGTQSSCSSVDPNGCYNYSR
jgi:hypothetical protein